MKKRFLKVIAFTAAVTMAAAMITTASAAIPSDGSTNAE